MSYLKDLLLKIFKAVPQVINTRVGDMASLNRIHEEIEILQVLGNHPGPGRT